MRTAVGRKRRRRRKRNTRKRRNTRSTRSTRRRRAAPPWLQMDKRTRQLRRTESQERWCLVSLLCFLLNNHVHILLFTFWICVGRRVFHAVFRLGIRQWSRGQLGRPGEAPTREGPALHEEGPAVPLPDVLKLDFLTFEFSTHSWCLSSTWFSFRMYKLLNLESFFLFSFYWFGTFWRVCFIKSLICQLVYYLNCKEACVVHNFKLLSRETVWVVGQV